MIGQRKAGAFVVSEIGRSGRERRSPTERRETSKPVPVDRRAAGERRTRADRRLAADEVQEPSPAPVPRAHAVPHLDAIVRHRRALSAQVGRDVGEDVAALDYLLNVTPTGPRPTVIDSAEMAKIEREAMTDTLTGLLNRGFLESALSREVARCRRHGVMTSLVLVAVDEFRATNERWGAAAGDAALRAVADIIRRQLRVADAACRYRGDEFAIILPDTYRSGALFVAERIVAAVRRQFEEGRIADCHIALTVSVGVAWYGATSATKTALIEAADSALRTAKVGGGDRVAEAF